MIYSKNSPCSAHQTLSHDTTPSSLPCSEFFPEVDPFFQIVDRLAELYVSYRGRFVIMSDAAKIFIPQIESDGKKVPAKLTNAMLCSHLNQRLAVSVYAGPYSAKFICFDVDDGNPDTVRKIIDLSEEAGVPRSMIYVSFSGGKGYHVEIFFDELVYTSAMRDFYNWVCFKGDLDRTKVEFRPTYTQAIKLPLSKNFKTGNVCCYVDRDTLDPIPDSRYIFEIERMSGKGFSVIADGLRQEYMRFIAPLDSTSSASIPTDDIKNNIVISDGLPELKERGTTHKTILAIAMHYRGKGIPYHEAREHLLDWLRRQNREYITDSDADVIRDIRYALDWVYSDKFTVHQRSQQNPCFTKKDVSLILSPEHKVDRRILFVIMYYEKIAGRASLSYDRISKLCGVSIVTAIAAVSRLIDGKYVSRKTGAVHVEDGAYVRERNTYWIDWASASRRNKLTKFLKDEHEITEVMTEENALAIYYGLLKETVEKPSLREILTRSEYKQLEVHYEDHE